MTPLEFSLLAFLISILAGALGALLGLGGGIIIVPALTLLLGLDIRYAIGASIVSVIATSSGAAAAYVREHLTNLRVGMFLELATTSGALTGAYLAGVIAGRWLFIIFGVVLAASAVEMLRQRHGVRGVPPRDAWADRLRLHAAFYDPARSEVTDYRVTHTKIGLGLMYVAGAVSGLLGIGSGVLKVPAMDLAMRMPLKASTATSNFMIGVTAAASAGVYFARGDMVPFVAGPVAVGVLVGAFGGSRLLGQIHSRVIRILFVIVLWWVSIEMLWKGIHWK
jgi:uncharacterized membrane protein YfcA